MPTTNGRRHRGLSRRIDERGTVKIKVAGKWLTLSFEGAYTELRLQRRRIPGSRSRVGPGIYLPLAGKTVTFTKANEDGAGYSNLGVFFDGADVTAVSAALTPATVVTDAAGKAMRAP